MMTETFSKLTDKLQKTALELETLSQDPDEFDDFRNCEIELKFKEINSIVSMLEDMLKHNQKGDNTTLTLLTESGR